MTLSGLLGLLLTPMDILTKTKLDGNYTPINTVLLILGFISAVGLYWRVWSYTRDGRVKLDTAATETGYPGGDAGMSGVSQVIMEEDESED